jgi:hypothetical protein
MQKFSGIYMGRRRKQTCETEAEMEGSGEDNESQILAGFARELQHSINLTQSTLVHHLQENQESVRRGQMEITETLERVNASQEKLAQLLMQMTHAGKGLKVYANREASGSHGGTRLQQEHNPRYHTKG